MVNMEMMKDCFLVFFLISEIILNFNKNNNSKIIDNLILTLFIIRNKVLLIPILIFNKS